MGMPSINIIFRELAKTFEQRNDNGIIALVLANNSGMNPKEYRPGDDLDASIAKDAKIQIQFAMEGGREKPQKVICFFGQSEYADLDTILDELDNVKFDYLTFGSALQEDQKAKVTKWIKEKRESGKKVKAVLANTTANDEGIINYTTESVTISGEEYDADKFCSRIAGILAGTPLTMSCTYTVLEDAESCTKLSKKEMDEKIDAGEFIVFRDGDYIRVARGINSLTTVSDTKTDDFKKIKMIDVMDHVSTDLTDTIKNNWLGQYPNNYDNKCLLLANCQEYLDGLVSRTILSSASIEIDIEGNKKYLESKNEDTVNMTEDQIKKALTGENVFLSSQMGILDAMENFNIDIVV